MTWQTTRKTSNVTPSTLTASISSSLAPNVIAWSKEAYIMAKRDLYRDKRALQRHIHTLHYRLCIKLFGPQHNCPIKRDLYCKKRDLYRDKRPQHRHTHTLLHIKLFGPRRNCLIKRGLHLNKKSPTSWQKDTCIATKEPNQDTHTLLWPPT